MRTVLRPGDVVARLGGDEFVIVLAHVETISSVRDRVVHALSERISASAGTATAPRDGTTIAELLAVADGRLYEVKNRRRAVTPALSNR